MMCGRFHVFITRESFHTNLHLTFNNASENININLNAFKIYERFLVTTEKCLYFCFPLNVDISQNAILHFGEFYYSIWLNDHERGSAGNKQIIRLSSLERSLNFTCNCARLIEKHEVFTPNRTNLICRKETLQPTRVTLAMQTLICRTVYDLWLQAWPLRMLCRLPWGRDADFPGHICGYTMHVFSRIKRPQRE